MKGAASWSLLMAGAVLLSGCGKPLDPELQMQVNTLDGKINSYAALAESSKRTLEAARTNSDLKAPIDREKLMAPVAALAAEVKEAMKDRDRAVKALAAKPDAFDAERIFDEASDEILDELEESSAAVKRSKGIVDAMRSPGQGEFVVDAVTTEVDRLAPLSARARRAAEAAAKRHPGKKTDLEARSNKLTVLQEKAIAMGKEAEEEAANQYKDRFRFARALVDGRTSAQEGIRQAEDILKRTDQLDQTTLITLQDMKADYTIIIARTSWDEYSDYSREETVTFPPMLISQSQFLEASKTSGDPRAQNDWIQRSGLLAQNPLPPGHDRFEAWIEDLDAKFYHLTSASINGQSLSRGWAEVRPFMYFDNVGNLGMDILSKPYGLYEDEALSIAAPHGMALVGNSRYGRWRRRGSGEFWMWYAGFRAIESYYRSHQYSRTEWQKWNTDYRGKKPFYGFKTTPNEEDSYGSTGSVTRGLFGGTTWAQTGAPGRTDPTVRGIGEWWRGGGPGGGGK